jgi:hypothetical protein
LTTAPADGSAPDQPPDAGKLDTVLRLVKEAQKLIALDREFEKDADPTPGTRLRR